MEKMNGDPLPDVPMSTQRTTEVKKLCRFVKKQKSLKNIFATPVFGGLFFLKIENYNRFR